MRSRGGAIGKAAGPFHLDLPAFPNQPSAAGGAHVLPLGPQTLSLLWVLLFFFTYLVFQPKETTSCFLTIPVLPQGMPCPWPVLLPPEILAVLLGPSSLPECSTFLNLPRRMSFLSPPTPVVLCPLKVPHVYLEMYMSPCPGESVSPGRQGGV